MMDDTMDTDDLDLPTIAMTLAGRLRDRVISNPLSTLAGAATVGYMIGWSMPSVVYRTLASMAMRAVAMQVASRVLGPHDDDDDDEIALDNDDLDLSGTGMPGDPLQAPPYVAQ
jgi:hypothetical protein